MSREQSGLRNIDRYTTHSGAFFFKDMTGGHQTIKGRFSITRETNLIRDTRRQIRRHRV